MVRADDYSGMDEDRKHQKWGNGSGGKGATYAEPKAHILKKPHE